MELAIKINSFGKDIFRKLIEKHEHETSDITVDQYKELIDTTELITVTNNIDEEDPSITYHFLYNKELNTLYIVKHYSEEKYVLIRFNSHMKYIVSTIRTACALSAIKEIKKFLEAADDDLKKIYVSTLKEYCLESAHMYNTNLVKDDCKIYKVEYEDNATTLYSNFYDNGIIMYDDKPSIYDGNYYRYSISIITAYYIMYDIK